MQTIILDKRPSRRLDVNSFSDVTSAVVTFVGFDPMNGYVIELETEVTEQERAAIIERAYTVPNEEILRARAFDAIAANTAWQENALPQIITGATTIEGHANASAFDKQLATAIKNLANRLNAMTQQSNTLIRLQLDELDATD